MAAAQVGDLTLGDYLKIVSQSGVYNNLSEDSNMWNYIKKRKKGNAEGREMRFLLRSAYGIAAAGFVAVNGGAFPSASQSTISEGTTQFKDFAVTVEVERTLIEKALSDFSRYGEPLAEEIRAKTIALSRILSASLYGDGTGVLGQAVDAGTISSGQVVFNVSALSSARGYIGWINFGDKLLAKNPDGTAATPTLDSGTFDHYAVVDRDRANSTVTLEARSSAGAALVVTATGVTAGDFLYRTIQTTYSDLGSVGSTDYNTLSEQWPGLAAFTATDGRKVNGITLSGALKSTVRDAGGAALDSSDFQKVMSQMMVNVGQGRYKYDVAMMAWEGLDSLIDSREADRRFQSIQDDKRGVKQLGYVHGKNTLLFEADEFCPEQKIYIPPAADVLQFHGDDFKFVEPNKGQKFHLRPNSSGYDRTVQAFMDGQGALHCVHNAALGVITNFTLIS